MAEVGVQQNGGMKPVVSQLLNGFLLVVTSDMQQYYKSAALSSPSADCQFICKKIGVGVDLNILLANFDQQVILEIKLPIDPLTEKNRGFALVTFISPKDAQTAARRMNGRKLEGLPTTIYPSDAKKIYLGNVPKWMSKVQMKEKLATLRGEVAEMITIGHSSSGNGGCCMLIYDDEKSALLAKAALKTRCDLRQMVIESGSPQNKPDSDSLQVAKLFIRNIRAKNVENNMSTYLRSVEKLVKSVKKVFDVSYVSFHKREDALVAKAHLEATAPGCTVTMAKSSLAMELEKEVLRAQDNRRLVELLEVVIPSQRLLIYGLPENKSMTALKNELGKVTVGVMDVVKDGRDNREPGSWFIEYVSHKSATGAVETLSKGGITIFDAGIEDQGDLHVDDTVPTLCLRTFSIVKKPGPEVPLKATRKRASTESSATTLFDKLNMGGNTEESVLVA